jgi:hypothetical protein
VFKDLRDFLYRDGDSSNTIIGIILLFMLLVFVGPDVLPTLLARTFPFLTEGVPCTRLQTANDRSQHQSLIGRNAVNPFEMRVVVPPVPEDPNATWNIQIVIQNTTIGTVPFVFDNQARIGIGAIPDSSGIGLVFSPNVNIQTGQPGSNAGFTTFPEDSIRLLGPRQRCAFRIQIPRSSVFVQAGATVRSYYRINTGGQIATTGAIFPDQGLNLVEGNIVQSEEETIILTVTAN